MCIRTPISTQLSVFVAKIIGTLVVVKMISIPPMVVLLTYSSSTSFSMHLRAMQSRVYPLHHKGSHRRPRHTLLLNIRIRILSLPTLRRRRLRTRPTPLLPIQPRASVFADILIPAPVSHDPTTSPLSHHSPLKKPRHNRRENHNTYPACLANCAAALLLTPALQKNTTSFSTLGFFHPKRSSKSSSLSMSASGCDDMGMLCAVGMLLAPNSEGSRTSMRRVVEEGFWIRVRTWCGVGG